MPELAQPAGRFRVIARGKLADAYTQEALDVATNRLRTNRISAWTALSEVEALRERAHRIRMEVIDDLEGHVARFTAALEACGGNVFFARTAGDASAYVAEVCRQRGAKMVAKSKSMAAEEIGLNEALEAVGVRPVETDLGEYILQLAGEQPVHIIAPAIEKTASQVAELLSQAGGEPIPAELEGGKRSAGQLDAARARGDHGHGAACSDDR
jgi:L-lactate dehydrogenase complex protein LldF